jgi:hypothetical protein
MGIQASTLPAPLKLELRTSRKLCSFFMSHSYLPATDKANFVLFLEHIKRDMDLPIFKDFHDSALSIFQNGSLYMMQELVVFLILTMEAPWRDRLMLLYECFRSQVTDAVTHCDISVMCQVSTIALLRAWKIPQIPLEKVSEYSEAVADQVYAKLDLDLDAELNKDPFIAFFLTRFPDDKVVKNNEELLKFIENLYNI